MMRYIKAITLLAGCMVLASCGNFSEETSSVDTSRGSIVSTTVQQYPQSFMSGLYLGAQAQGYTASLAAAGIAPNFSVNQYNIIYNTIDVNGNKTVATAKLLIPSTNKNVNLVVYLHGTELKDANAPSKTYADFSNFDGVDPATIKHNFSDMQESMLNTLAASTGYAVLMPNYLGLGMDGDGLHPYMHKDSLASSTIDAIRAALHYEADASTVFTFSKKFVLAGYSEGGYAAMATHKVLQSSTDTSDLDYNTNLKGVFPGGAPLNLSKIIANEMLNTTGYKIPAFAAYVYAAYNSVFQDYPDIASGFNSYTGIENDFDGTKDLAQVNLKIMGHDMALAVTKTPISIFSTIIKDDITQGYEAYKATGFTDTSTIPASSKLYKRIVDNDLCNFDPGTIPYLFLHSTSDEIVPVSSVTECLASSSFSSVSQVLGGALGTQLVPLDTSELVTEPTDTHHSKGGGVYIFTLYGVLKNPLW